MKKRIVFQGDSITDAGRNREDFYSLGYGYPLLVAALVLAGSFTGLEVYTGVLNIVIVSIALLVSTATVSWVSPWVYATCSNRRLV